MYHACTLLWQRQDTNLPMQTTLQCCLQRAFQWTSPAERTRDSVQRSAIAKELSLLRPPRNPQSMRAQDQPLFGYLTNWANILASMAASISTRTLLGRNHPLPSQPTFVFTSLYRAITDDTINTESGTKSYSSAEPGSAQWTSFSCYSYDSFTNGPCRNRALGQCLWGCVCTADSPTIASCRPNFGHRCSQHKESSQQGD